MGISSKDTSRFNKNYIRAFSYFNKNIHFPEFLSDKFENQPSKTKLDHFFYIFVSPRKLSEDEIKELERIRHSEPEYYQGVKNGWSILFLGDSDEKIIKPGIVLRSEMIKDIDARFKEKYKEYTFKFLDDFIIKL